MSLNTCDDYEWSYESVIPVDKQKDNQFIGACFPSGTFEIEVENGVVNVPIGLLMQCKLFADLFEYSVWTTQPLKVEKLNVHILNVLIAWGDGILKTEDLPWSDVEMLVKTSDFLGLEDFLRDLAYSTIVSRIHGEWSQIRARLTFSYERCQLDPDNWEFDPTLELDNENFVMNYFSTDMILEIANSLSRKDLVNFVLSFGDHPLKGYLSKLYNVGPII